MVDRVTLFQDRRWKLWVAEQLNDSGSGRVLDIGCGTLLLEERLVATGRTFVGIDLTEEMVRAGREKRLPNVVLALNGDAEALPFKDGRFAAVVSCYVAKYVDLGKFLDEIARVCRARAQVIIYDFARPRGALAPFLELYILGGLRVAGFLLSLAGQSTAFAYANLPGIINRSTWDREVVKELEKRGFQTVDARKLTGGVVFACCGRKVS